MVNTKQLRRSQKLRQPNLNKKLKKKKTYYYKVRAIKKAGKKVTYSKYSKAVSVKIKK